MSQRNGYRADINPQRNRASLSLSPVEYRFAAETGDTFGPEDGGEFGHISGGIYRADLSVQQYRADLSTERTFFGILASEDGIWFEAEDNRIFTTE